MYTKMIHLCKKIGALLLAGAIAMSGEARSLVPKKKLDTQDYYSTWNIQGYKCSYEGFEPMIVTMTEQSIFGDGLHENWIGFYPQFRGDLYFLLDDSWDIPEGTHGDGSMNGAGRLDETRFPFTKGKDPVQRMKMLVQRVKKAGWKGLGLWLCAQEATALVGNQTMEEYWIPRLRDSYEAGVSYWKVDYGAQDKNYEWRKKMTELARIHAPGMIIEHAYTPECLTTCDVYRTYDVENIISVPVTLQRIAPLLSYKAEGEALGLINCEDEPYIAVGLGCAIGVMRHPFNGNLPNGKQDHVFPPCGRDLKSRIDEETRAIMWHRIAAPFGVANDGRVDDVKLTDTWVLAEDETWVPTRKVGETITESAPARMSRNMPLPVVTDGADDPMRPFLMASRYPNGAVAVSAVERSQGRRSVQKAVGVSIKVEEWDKPVGVFGYYKELTVNFDTEIPAGKRLFAQDLIAKEAQDITDEVRIEGRKLIVPGHVIQRIGKMAQSSSDKSAPGLVMQFM